MAYFVLRPDGIAAAHALAGTTLNRELAPLLDIDQSNLSRLAAGKTNPGVVFVAGVARAFGFDRLGDIVEVVA